MKQAEIQKKHYKHWNRQNSEQPTKRSSVYDFTKEDVEEMFTAMQDALDSAKEEFDKKFEGRAKAERKMFSFGTNPVSKETEEAMQEENNVATETENV